MADFNTAFGWNSSLQGDYVTAQNYPVQPDLLFPVAGGSQDQNRVYAELIDRVQNSLMRVESQVQYTPRTGGSEGSLIAHLADWRQVGAGRAIDFQGPYRLGIKFSLIPEIAALFGGTPFAAQYGVATSAVGYLPTGSGNQYFPVTSAVNVTGPTSCIVSSVRTDGGTWPQYGVTEVVLMLIRP